VIGPGSNGSSVQERNEERLQAELSASHLESGISADKQETVRSFFQLLQ
jgi:hypothetical protein